MDWQKTQILDADPSKKEDLVVSFWLPELENSKNLKIDILDKNLGLKTVNQEKKYRCTISLPYNVESKISKAIFKNTEVNFCGLLGSFNKILAQS